MCEIRDNGSKLNVLNTTVSIRSVLKKFRFVKNFDVRPFVGTLGGEWGPSFVKLKKLVNFVNALDSRFTV